jgi:hypothetical protein
MADDEFTTIAALLSGAEAEMARDLLVAQGIDAMVQGTGRVEEGFFDFNASLRVRRTDEARAREVLAETGVLELLRHRP